MNTNPEWKLVPLEPTPKMIDATWDHSVDRDGGIESQSARNRRIYAAMLAAASAARPLTVVLDPDPRGVSVGVYQGSSCVYNGAHPIPTGATGERDWELSCDECNGSGHVFVKHQVAERKTDVQEFKEECEACEGRGFNIAFEDIPGIAEYVKSCRPAYQAATGEDERKAFEAWWRRTRGLTITKQHYFELPEVYSSWEAWQARAAGDALDALRELVACDNIKKQIASMQVCVLETDDDVQELDGLMSDLARRQPAAWDAARAAIAQQSQRKEA